MAISKPKTSLELNSRYTAAKRPAALVHAAWGTVRAAISLIRQSQLSAVPLQSCATATPSVTSVSASSWPTTSTTPRSAFGQSDRRPRCASLLRSPHRASAYWGAASRAWPWCGPSTTFTFGNFHSVPRWISTETFAWQIEGTL